MTTSMSLPPSGAPLGWVCSRDFAAHVRHMSSASGIPWRVLAILAGVPSRTVVRLMGLGRPMRRIRAVDAERLLMLTPLAISAAEHQLVDPTSTLRRVHILLENRHTLTEVSTYLDVSAQDLAQLLTARDPRCTAMMRVRARAACEAHHLLWADQPDEVIAEDRVLVPECAA
ncbi:hypothetical protein [Acidipropionibacterium virtanenii]|uniref:Uncharacterized protein n=1 Tax=Acidipropionibacterium virtanenii TaxID=2057246 RepID=A0A344UVE0_9ACTN|nr:hypothetical protein [Acidipropionibacterium virtanenii]AXE39238.1 hypothetical protein JS278_02086 [Acidipropionibacterium virtanenii]